MLVIYHVTYFHFLVADIFSLSLRVQFKFSTHKRKEPNYSILRITAYVYVGLNKVAKIELQNVRPSYIDREILKQRWKIHNISIRKFGCSMASELESRNFLATLLL